jgi:hypothetical protein
MCTNVVTTLQETPYETRHLATLCDLDSMTVI